MASARRPKPPKPTPVPAPEPPPPPPPPPPLEHVPYQALVPERYRCTALPLELKVQPVALSPEHVQACRDAVDQWNATGFVHFEVLDVIPDDPNTTDQPTLPHGQISVQYYAPGRWGALNSEAHGHDIDGYIASPAIWMNADTGVGFGATEEPIWYFLHQLRHEFGHTLGLLHNNEDSIMGNWMKDGPTAYDIAELAQRYPNP